MIGQLAFWMFTRTAKKLLIMISKILWQNTILNLKEVLDHYICTYKAIKQKGEDLKCQIRLTNYAGSLTNHTKY